MFEMEAAVLSILGTALSGNQLAIIKKTLEALKNLSDGDGKFKLFEKNSHSSNKGSFQIGLASEENDQVALTFAGFQLNTQTDIKQIVFF